jgi:hypothetical protein
MKRRSFPPTSSSASPRHARVQSSTVRENSSVIQPDSSAGE